MKELLVSEGGISNYLLKNRVKGESCASSHGAGVGGAYSITHP